MIRILRDTLAFLGAIVGAGGLWEVILDRLARRGRGPDTVMHMTVAVDAPIERVWAYVADVERQPEWMREMKAVRLLTPGPVGEGTRGEATVRIAGIAVTDPVTVDLFEPPRRFGIRHEGLFGGGGVITLVPVEGGAATAVHWAEQLVPPIFPHLGAVIQRPLLTRVFQGDMDRMRAIVESGADLAAGGADLAAGGADLAADPPAGRSRSRADDAAPSRVAVPGA